MRKTYSKLLSIALLAISPCTIAAEKTAAPAEIKSSAAQDCERLSVRKLANFSNFYNGKCIEVKEAYVHRLVPDTEETGICLALISDNANDDSTRIVIQVDHKLFDAMDAAMDQEHKISIKCIGCGYKDGTPLAKALSISIVK